MVVVAILDVNPAPQIPSPSDPCLEMGGCGVVDSKLDALGVEIEDGAAVDLTLLPRQGILKNPSLLSLFGYATAPFDRMKEAYRSR